MGRPKGSKNKPKVADGTPNLVNNDSIKFQREKERLDKASQIEEWYANNKHSIENFAKANESLKKLKDANKNTQFKSVSKVSKEQLISWLQNPTGNEKNLRDLSQYLYYRSHLYYKIIKYHSNMFEMDIRSTIPKYDMIKDNDVEKIKKSYQQTLNIVDRMNLQSNFIRVASICLRDDVFYGCKYFDSKKGHCFILPLNPDYCKINGFYETGDLAFSFDCSYLKKYPELIELWGSPFDKMYKDFQSTKQKWQPMPDEHCACFKFRYEDLDVCIPPFSGIMNSLLSLLALEDLQDVLDEQQIYKLLVATIPTNKGTNSVDDFSVDPNTAIDYFNRILDMLPDYLGAVLSPIPIDQISFEDNASSDINRIEKATQAVLNTAGGAQILNSAKISGTTAVNAALRADTEFAISTLLPQIEAWVNRMLTYELSNPCKVKFMHTSSYLKGELRKELLEDAQYGSPTKLLLNTIHGFSDADTISLNFLEENVLNVTESFVPLQSSHTQSGNEDNTKSSTELTDEGEASIDKRDNSNG